MAIYAFDGTWNKNKPDDDKDTNVVKFYESYEKEYSGPGNCHYITGVGTRWWLIGRILGGVFGIGGYLRLWWARNYLKKNIEAGDSLVDIIGFSRGAALAVTFANQINDHFGGLEVRFLGIWDIVGSFGIPGNDLNIGYKIDVPANVKNIYHAMSLDESRLTFPITRLSENSEEDRSSRNISEVWFRGAHSDIGGGNRNIGLSSIALLWLLQRAKDRQLPIAMEDLEGYRNAIDREAPIKQSKLDRDAKPRVIAPTDVIHISVSDRGNRDGIDHQDPPHGLAVELDNGELANYRYPGPV